MEGKQNLVILSFEVCVSKEQKEQKLQNLIYVFDEIAPSQS